jgi:hypothetical protein
MSPAPLTWFLTGNLTYARDGYAGAVLPDGKVLVTGGDVHLGPDTPTTSCELYDPVPGTWSAAGPLGTARSFHNAILLNNGQVLIVGGASGGSGSSCLTSCELYDPSTNTCSPTGSMAEGRALIGIWLLSNGKVLVAGGIPTFVIGTSLGTSELYDPSTGLWTPTGDLNTAVGGPSAVTLSDGTPLCIAGNQSGPWGNSSQIYSVSDGTWSATTGVSAYSFECGGGNNSILLNNGKVLTAAGNPPPMHSGVCELYDPGTQTYTLTGSLNIPRAEACLFKLSDGRILIAGGDLSDGESCTNTCEIYDPSLGTWTMASPLTTNRATGPSDLGFQLHNGDLLWPSGAYNFTSLNGTSVDRLSQTGITPVVVSAKQKASTNLVF